ncbi:hypothetical protein QF031_000494 [Pseudarthrobacter defluvii]|uniref:hypothetical protein n=1 Tax=Pseudarthrobacter defluvii TaxID=410837 RepID=UPI00278A0DC0|nr:hypothetical protein [Pseudarthrobacter defluvii]MDQ0767745.1 hypothetical protein [Pseudarthrobacter defluvii]
MPSHLSSVPRARTDMTVRRSLPGALITALLGVAIAGCSPVTSGKNADVPKWRATALPSSPAGVVLQDSGKILNRDRIVQEAARVPAGSYTLTAVCDGTGKAFFAVSLDGKALTEAGAACNGRQETTKITLPTAGRVEISTSSVDAPLLYAYRLVPAQ